MIRANLVLLAALCAVGCDRSDQQAKYSSALPPVAAALNSTPPQSASETAAKPMVLKTKDFVVTITDDRPEGDVTSHQVRYFAISRHTGASLRLTGSTMHTRDADGTPARLLGYEFKNGNTTYRVYQGGQLLVTRGKSHVVVDETGTWE